MTLRVVPLPSLEQQYHVRDGSTLDLPCLVEFKLVKRAQWLKDGEPLKESSHHSVNTETGYLSLTNTSSEATPGLYSCSLETATGRKKEMRAVVSMKPDIFLARSTELKVSS